MNQEQKQQDKRRALLTRTKMKILLCLSIFTFCTGVSSQTFQSYAKQCSDCHATASICTQKTGYVICACISGYIGNGVNCTAMSFCGTQTCCPSGYYWDNRIGYKVCTDINECTDSTLNKCVPSSTCKNMNGIYLCTSSRSTNCTTSPCPYDQDCLNTAGTVQCSDPCLSYQALNGTRRLSTINSTGVFPTDRYNFGWFQYIGSSGLRMQEGCVGTLKCGSLTPFSLNGTHPTIGEGVKMVPLQINSLSGCLTGANIAVKACPGNFYIYKFTGTVQSDVFCTDPLFTSSSVIPTMIPTTTEVMTTITTSATTTTSPPTSTTTTTTTTPTTTTPTTTPPTTTTTTPTTTTPTTTTPTTTTPTTTTPTTTTPTTTTPTTTTPTTTTPTTTTPTTTTPTTTTPTTTTPTTTTPTTTTPTTTRPTSTTFASTMITSQTPKINITVTTVRSNSSVCVTTSSSLMNNTKITHLEINKTATIFIETQTITRNTIRTKTNISVTHSSVLIVVGYDGPITLTDTPAPQFSGNETVVANLQTFQSNLYNSKPIEIHTLTETFTIPGDGFASTITMTTTTTDEVIVKGA